MGLFLQKTNIIRDYLVGGGWGDTSVFAHVCKSTLRHESVLATSPAACACCEGRR